MEVTSFVVGVAAGAARAHATPLLAGGGVPAEESRHCAAWNSVEEHRTAQHSTAQHSTAQHSTAQHSTARHSTAQRRTA